MRDRRCSFDGVSEWLGRTVHGVGHFDRAVSGAVARIPVSGADRGMLRLTRAADRGALWSVIAVLLAARPGATRRAALRGAVSVAGASVAVNVVLKGLIARRRPAAELLPLDRRLIRAPTSSSFPSGHSAGAAAFVTAVALESPRTALVVAPLAATVAYSRVHTGVHWTSDIVVGAAVGAGVALATRLWWPVRESDEAAARLVREVPALVDGKGLVLLVNPVSGDPGYDPTADVAAALPAATVLRTEPGRDCVEQLEQALAERAEQAYAVGAAGGDGTIAAAAAVALRHGLALVVVPTGTLNHFARDLGVYDLVEVVDATGAGEAVAVDIASVEFDTEQGTRMHYWINTASLGAYPDLVRLREKWQGRWGKWRPSPPPSSSCCARRSRSGSDWTTGGTTCGSCSWAMGPTIRTARSPRSALDWMTVCSMCVGCVPICGGLERGPYSRWCWPRSGAARSTTSGRCVS